jgi:hypothetical protein
MVTSAQFLYHWTNQELLQKALVPTETTDHDSKNTFDKLFE